MMRVGIAWREVEVALPGSMLRDECKRDYKSMCTFVTYCGSCDLDTLRAQGHRGHMIITCDCNCACVLASVLS